MKKNDDNNRGPLRKVLVVLLLVAIFAACFLVTFRIRFGGWEYGQSDSHVNEQGYELWFRFEELFRLGRYSEAIPVLEKYIRIMEKEEGPEHFQVCAGIYRLAQLHLLLNDLEKAEKLYEKALGIAEETIGPDAPETAQILNDLGFLWSIKGDYARLSDPTLSFEDNRDYTRAKRTLERALSIFAETVGEENRETLNCQMNLGRLYYQAGDYDASETMFASCAEISEKTSGPNTKDLANMLSDLAMVYEAKGDDAKAEEFYQKSALMGERVLGEGHPDLSTTLYNLAIFYAKQDDIDETLSHINKSLVSQSNGIKRTLGFASEKQRLSYLLGNRLLFLHMYMNMINHFKDGQPDVADAGFDTWLVWKGLILDSLMGAGRKSGPGQEEVAKELKTVRDELTRLAFGDKQDKQKIEELESEKERLEAQLYQSDGTDVREAEKSVDHLKVAAMLPQNSILLDFARIEMNDFTQWLPAHYFVFVLRPAGQVRMVDLGDAVEIDEAVTELKNRISGSVGPKKDRAIRPVARLPENEMDDILRASIRLWQLVIEPIEDELEGADTVYVSPDGNLSLIPFEVIAKPGGQFLIEKHTFNYLAAGRHILDFAETKKPKTGPAAIMGDPDFELPGDDGQTEMSKSKSSGQEERMTRSVDMLGFLFDRLPGTKIEAEAIGLILGEDKTDIFIGNDAREETLMNLKSPKYLHIATHCFFLGDQDAAPQITDGNVRSIVPEVSSQSKEMDNPLLRSGIVLSGANWSLKTGGMSDGIVTAEKILGLNLNGTEMAVLSGCDTGLGQIRAGEGVFGLRRAFARAGAASVVMSMWQVPDLETKELMIAFYRNIAENGMNRSQALRDATLKQKKVVEERLGNPNPYYWGAFVFMGKP